MSRIDAAFAHGELPYILDVIDDELGQVVGVIKKRKRNCRSDQQDDLVSEAIF